jgi:hypothetical protein
MERRSFNAGMGDYFSGRPRYLRGSVAQAPVLFRQGAWLEQIPQAQPVMHVRASSAR